MAKPAVTNDPHQPDPSMPSCPVDSHRKTQTPVPNGDKGDPTRDTWQEISGDKVQTRREEMPAPVYSE